MQNENARPLREEEKYLIKWFDKTLQEKLKTSNTVSWKVFCFFSFSRQVPAIDPDTD